jgi:hypothetical protein
VPCDSEAFNFVNFEIYRLSLSDVLIVIGFLCVPSQGWMYICVCGHLHLYGVLHKQKLFTPKWNLKLILCSNDFDHHEAGILSFLGCLCRVETGGGGQQWHPVNVFLSFGPQSDIVVMVITPWGIVTQQNCHLNIRWTKFSLPHDTISSCPHNITDFHRL